MRSSLILVFLQLWGNVQVSLSQNVTCPELPDVPNAYVSEETRKPEYHMGHVIHFTCETGYISGPTIRYVCTDGGWLGVRHGKCYLKPCPLPDDTPNGHYQIIKGEDLVFGTIIKYFCNEGYQMVSREDTRTCLLDQWTNHVPVCDPLSCKHPPTDEHITVKGLPENDDLILPDRFLKFSCDGPGKILNGSSVLTCGTDGQWDHPIPTCEDVSCKLGDLHSALAVNGLPAANEGMKTGHKLQFRCNTGHTLHGPKKIECLSTGQWNQQPPTCHKKCPITGVPQNMRISPNPQNRDVNAGVKLHFQCYHGETLRGAAQVECLNDGRWSASFPTCEAPSGCEISPLLENGDTKNTVKFQHRHNERVEYICQNYYVMEGEPYRTCNDGKWTGQMRCLKPCTVDREAMDKHNIQFKFRRDDKLYSAHNDEIEFTCKRGTSPSGRVAMRQRCLDGVMHLPTCR